MVNNSGAQAPGLAWLFFGTSGRIARRSFSLATFFLLLLHVFVIIQLIKADDNSASLVWWTLVLFVIAAVSLWCIFALIVKRLHDIGVTGFLSLAIVFTGMYFIAFIVLSLWPSQSATNKYGPPPFWPEA
ncbi:MAG: DUF805 domain-containing protein [Rhizobiaceae bacterium]|nr:DUF805 domain-containing protein [Rhizobiaceae bacterium]